MKKQTKDNIYYLALILTFVGFWLVMMYYGQKNPNKDLYTESVDNFIEIPEKGDLYVVLNKDKEIIEYFKVIGLKKNGQLEVAVGTDDSHLLSKKYSQSNWVVDRLSEDIASWDSLTIKSIESLYNGNERLKIFRQYQTEKMQNFRRIIFSPWGFLSITILSFILIWLGRSLSEFIETAYSIKKGWFEISSIFLLFFFINPFEFENWIFEVSFCLLSIVPVYFVVKRSLKKSLVKKESIGRKELNIVNQIMCGGALIQFLSLVIISFPINIEDYLNMDGNHHFSSITFTWAAVALGNLLNNIRKYFVELKLKDKQLLLTQLKVQQSKAELDALQSRVNPHFLYNSLNSIAGLAQEDPAKTEEMAIALSHFYKQSTNRQGEHWNTIEEALELLQNYLSIEKIRFGDRLQFEILCPDFLKQEKIPRFLIQPLIENAVKYGYQSSTNSMTIRLELEKVKDKLLIRLFDQGPPFPDNLQSGYGVWLL